MATVGTHSNLGLYKADQLGNAGRHTMGPGDGTFDDMRNVVDGTPQAVALIGLGALGVMFGLKFLGFRFSFGVSAGR